MNTTKSGAELISEERARQISKKGYDSDHDDRHDRGEIACAAACYAAPEAIFVKNAHTGQITFSDPWPWGWQFDKRKRGPDGGLRVPGPRLRIRQLVKAGALIAAEIDRLNRLKTRQ